MSYIEKWFRLRENNTSVATEIRAGAVTFLTMSYIVFVQPLILRQTGLSWHTVFVATCVASALATLLMAFLANYPIALAPAMGHNLLFLMYCQDGTINWQTGLGALFISGSLFIVMSFWGLREKIINVIPGSLKHAIAVGIGLLIAFLGFQWAGLVVKDPTVLVRMGNLHSTPVLLALGGLVLTATLVALRLRGAILIGILVTAAVGIPLGITPTEAVRKSLVGLPRPDVIKTVAILPLRTGGLVRADDARELSTALDNAAVKHYTKDKVIPTAESIKLLEGVELPPSDCKAPPEVISKLAREHLKAGLVVLPHVPKPEKDKAVLNLTAYDADEGKIWREYYTVPWPVPRDKLDLYAKNVVLGLPGHSGAFKLDIIGALSLGLVQVIFVFFFLDLFDTIGTLVGVAQQAGFLVNGKLPRARGALLADACGTVIGACTGTSTITSYIESSAGVADGGRTGLANVVTAILFILTLFFYPVVMMIASGYGNLHPAVAPVLIIIGSIMLRNVVHIKWTDPTEAIPAFISIMIMPLTFSITEGISFGFISYSFLKLVTGRGREVHWLLYLFSALFIVRYVVTGT